MLWNCGKGYCFDDKKQCFTDTDKGEPFEGYAKSVRLGSYKLDYIFTSEDEFVSIVIYDTYNEAKFSLYALRGSDTVCNINGKPHTVGNVHMSGLSRDITGLSGDITGINGSVIRGYPLYFGGIVIMLDNGFSPFLIGLVDSVGEDIRLTEVLERI